MSARPATVIMSEPTATQRIDETHKPGYSERTQFTKDVEKSSKDSEVTLLLGHRKVSYPWSQMEELIPPETIIERSDHEVHLPYGVHVQTVQTVVDSLQQGRVVDISRQNVFPVLKCASLLGMEGVKGICTRYLSESVSADNCFRLRKLAIECSASRLAAQCDSFIANSLGELLTQEDFLSLPRIQVDVEVSSQLFEFTTDACLLEKLLPRVVKKLEEEASSCFHLEESVIHLVLTSDFSLSHSISTTDVTDCLVRSAENSPAKGLSTLSKLAKIQPSTARKLELGDPKTGENGSWKVITDVSMSEIASICLIDRGSSLAVLNITLHASDTNDNLFPASPTTGLPAYSGAALIAQMNSARSGFGVIATESRILAIGGYNREGCLENYERYDFTCNSWESMGKMHTKRARFAATELCEDVYVIGGSDGREELGSVEMFDQKLQSWIRLNCPMPTARSCLGAALLDGKIYVVGGSCYSKPLRTVEQFDPVSRCWKVLPSMKTARCDLAVVAYNGKVYALGGQTSGWSCLASVECFDPAHNSWRQVAPMNTPRRNAAAIAVKDKIYVVGGYNGSTALNSVEIYDPLTNQWTFAEPMHVKRSSAAIAHSDGVVFVVGGYTGSSFLNSVECFNLDSQTWTSFV